MKEQPLSKKELNRRAAVSGFFFVFAQLFVRGITFILTPIYTRLVSTAQYGEIRVYESWLLILVPIFSISLYRSVERAKFEFPDHFNEFVSSALTLSYLAIFGSYLIIVLFFRKIFMNFFGLDRIMYIFMMLYTFSYTAFLFYQRREKQMLRYKNSVILTMMMMIPASVLSVLLLFWGNSTGRESSLVDLRVIGYYSPQIIGGLIAAVMMIRQGHFSIKKEYWKFALKFSLPLIPETISIQIMNQADKIMIQKMTGSENTGLFSLATTISFIIWIIEDAVWTAWMPWLYEKLDRKEVEEVRKPWFNIVYIFSYFSWALVMLAPELVRILGGSKYAESCYLVIPMVTGTLFRFFSYSFTAVENFQKKTQYCALGTVIAMVINVILNYVCILLFGYQAAAYTTAVSYFMLVVIQGFLEKKVCGMRVVPYGKMLLISVIVFGINLASGLFYRTPWFVRWGVLLIVSAAFIWKLMPQFKPLLKQLRKEKE